ncbi:hypothetical protein [Alsobacter soli]|nr:hypothetical protein [Alsobacter soli]
MLKYLAPATAGILLGLCATAWAGDPLAADAPADAGRIQLAQYYYPPPPPPPGYYRPRPRYGYEDPYHRPRPRVRMTDMCITSRGSCPVPPQPYGRPCGCRIPGFGFKRGATGY